LQQEIQLASSPSLNSNNSSTVFVKESKEILADPQSGMHGEIISNAGMTQSLVQE
jgi:hypothetical protein